MLIPSIDLLGLNNHIFDAMLLKLFRSCNSLSAGEYLNNLVGNNTYPNTYPNGNFII